MSCPVNGVITITETCQVVVEPAETQHVVVTDTTTEVVDVVTAGPQGIPGPAGPAGPAGTEITNLAAEDGSVVFWNGSASRFEATAEWTRETLTDAGNF